MIPASVVPPESVGLDGPTLKRFTVAQARWRKLMDEIASHEEGQVEAEYARRVAKMTKAISAGGKADTGVSRELVRGEFQAVREATAAAILELKLTLIGDLERLAQRTTARLAAWVEERQKRFEGECQQWGIPATLLFRPGHDDGEYRQTPTGPVAVGPPQCSDPIIREARIQAHGRCETIRELAAEWLKSYDGRGVSPDAALAIATTWTLRDVTGPTVAESLTESYAPIGAAAIA